MDMTDAAKLLLFSGAASMLFSTFLGFLMLVPMQPWGRHLLKGMNFKQFGAAHLDWLMLGLMQGLAGGLVVVFAVDPAPSAVWAMVLGGWLNPLAYVFRAFGVNAFAFDGSATQRLAGGAGVGFKCGDCLCLGVDPRHLLERLVMVVATAPTMHRCLAHVARAPRAWCSATCE